MAYRSSRALIVLGTFWALGALSLSRLVLHFIRFGNFNIGRERPHNLAIIGSKEESERVQNLLQKARVHKNLIGTVAPQETAEAGFLGRLQQLNEIVHIYKIDELIFCSKDVSSQQIMHWMSRLGPGVEYKIVPEESLSIIGSHSKNTTGELYTIDIQFDISQPLQKRNKRLLDFLLATSLFLTWPLQIFLVKKPLGLLQNIANVATGRRSWVGYAGNGSHRAALPPTRPGILNTIDNLGKNELDDETIQRLNLLYAKDYRIGTDLEIIWRAWRSLGRT